MSKITVWNKEGVLGDLHPLLQKELGKVIWLHERAGYINFYITSKREGNHKLGSFHPIGRAVDFATAMPYSVIKAAISPDFDLVSFNGGESMHLEYDPKRADI